MTNFSIQTKIKNFFFNPVQLFWFYIAVNMIPSVGLVFTEPFSFIGKLLLISFPLGLYLFVFSLFKNTGLTQLILFPLLILHAFQLVLFYLFGEAVIAVDMFLNLATTNVSEASELLDNIWPAIVIVCLLYIPTTVIAVSACKYKLYPNWHFRKAMMITGAILIVVSYSLTFTAKNQNTNRFTVHEDLYPTNILYNLGFAVNKWHRMAQYPTHPDFKFNATKNEQAAKREIYVLVVGEASRAENWELFGYQRNTNPKLSQTPGLVLYKDAITQSNTTHKSVPLILSAASAENYDVIYTQKSVSQAFREAGFSTIFLSNQIPNRSFIDFFAGQADYTHNIRESSAGGIITINNYDESLIPLFQHYIDSLPGNLFFVLHTYGSHFNYKERYPSSFSHFTPDNATDVKVKNKQQLVNAYDNSIRYTDDFLHKIIGILQHTDATTALLYSADHGEDLLDDKRHRFLHSSPNPTFYQLHIPVFLWFSENYQTHFPQKVNAAESNSPKPVATNAVFHTLLDMAAIRTDYLQPDLSLVNPDFKIVPRMYLNDHDKPIFYYKAGLKKYDKEMIEKKGLHHSL